MASWKAYAAGIAWATIFGLSFLVTKDALEVFSPVSLLFFRFALATAVMVGLELAGVVRLRYAGKPRRPLLLTCLLQPVLYFTLETFGLRETASSTAGLILGAMPAAVAALSVPMLKERLSARQVLGLALSIAGVVLIVMQGGSVPGGPESGTAVGRTIGVLLLVGALASAAFYNVYSRKASAHYAPAETTFAMMASGAAFFGALALVESLAGARPLGPATPAAWGAVAYLGILSSVVAFFLVNLSLSRLKAAQSAIFGTLTTLVALVAGVTLRGEAFGAAQALGAAAIVAGVWLTNARALRGGAA
ncbi:MAG: DMT family transporter [Spirochaetes bacterium]|nr:DMT family transporter [Spirochaetota bacterium]MBU1082387.1 DMT family transporter [Spirochaetota bacterium]